MQSKYVKMNSQLLHSTGPKRNPSQNPHAFQILTHLISQFSLNLPCSNLSFTFIFSHHIHQLGLTFLEIDVRKRLPFCVAVLLPKSHRSVAAAVNAPYSLVFALALLTRVHRFNSLTLFLLDIYDRIPKLIFVFGFHKATAHQSLFQHS